MDRDNHVAQKNEVRSALTEAAAAESEPLASSSHKVPDGRQQYRNEHKDKEHGVASSSGSVISPTRQVFDQILKENTAESSTLCQPSDSAQNVVRNDTNREESPTASLHSTNSYVCRICHNAENPDKLVSPCMCKGSLTYVHIHCLERWISTSRSTTCELCQFQYNTEQTLRYTCIQSLRMWYSRSMSRRALQEDCQMFSLLTLVAFGIIGTLLVGIQYYFVPGRTWALGKLWTKGWLIFFLTTTLVVYFVNIYMIVRSQLSPWYRWWQSARDIKLILENRKPYPMHAHKNRCEQSHNQQAADMPSVGSVSSLAERQMHQLQQQLQQQQQQPLQQQQQLQPLAELAQQHYPLAMSTMMSTSHIETSIKLQHALAFDVEAAYEAPTAQALRLLAVCGNALRAEAELGADEFLADLERII